MEKNYLYKTRVSLVNLDVILLFVISILAFFINVFAGVIIFVLFLFWVISIVSMRIYVYEDRIEYKTGIIIKTYSKTMPLKNVSVINYSSDILGKIFNYGDIVIGTFNVNDSFNIKGVKNAKMLCENLKALLYKE